MTSSSLFVVLLLAFLKQARPQSTLGCYDAYTPSYSCYGYVNCGYTCVGSYCAYAGTDCKCSCTACAVFHATMVLDPTQGKCVAPSALITPYSPTPASGATKFTYTGSQQKYYVPQSATTLQIDACGAQGSNIGGLGGFIRSSVPVTGGSTLYVYVGGYGLDSLYGTTSAGYNGGGTVALWGNGGGGSDVRIMNGGADGKNAASWLTRLAVAGGGGAAYGTYAGGLGGGSTGGAGAPLTRGGLGGSQTAGGATHASDPCSTRGAGSLFSGGSCFDGLGGGGGWYGGAAGYMTGGGGSSYTVPSGVMVINNQGDIQCRSDGVLYITAFTPSALPVTYFPSTSTGLSQGILVGVVNLPQAYTLTLDIFPTLDCPQCDWKNILHLLAISAAGTTYRLPSLQMCSSLHEPACPASWGLYAEYLGNG